jgi:hypothetical protein
VTPLQRRALELAGLVEGGSNAAGQGAGQIVDVRWASPTWDGAFFRYPDDTPAQDFAFGTVRLTELFAGDWACFVQPVRVLRQPGDYWPTPGAGIPPAGWQNGDQPGPWWPEASNVVRSPFVLEVTHGPEEGVIQRFEVPARGLCVALRGANVSATLRYDRSAFGSIPAPPYEPPGPQARGFGRMRLVLTPGLPAARFVNLACRRVPVGGVASVPLPGWLPAFTTRIERIESGAALLQYRTPTNRLVGTLPDGNPPQQAVSVVQTGGDVTVPRTVTVEVFA